MSTSSGTLGTALNVASGDAGASLGGNLLNGKGLSIKNNDSALQAMALPGLSTLMPSGGSGSSSGGAAAKYPTAANNSSNSQASQPMMIQGGAAPTVSQGSAPQGGAGYVSPNVATISNPSAFGQIDTSVGGSQLGANMASSDGQPASLLQILAQSGRSTAGY